MSRQASKTVIGAFVVAAAALAVAAVVIFGSGRLFSRTQNYVLYFNDSMKGLNVGAPVYLKGVKIGSVTEINLQICADDLNFLTSVVIQIHGDQLDVVGGEDAIREQLGLQGASDEKLRKMIVEQLIENGLRARLGVQSMVTGQLMVELDFHPDTEALWSGCKNEHPELPTILSQREIIASTLEKLPLQQIINDLHLTLQGIEEKVNSPELEKGFSSFYRILEELSHLVRTLNEQFFPMESDLSGMIKDIRKLAQNLDSQITPLSASFQETMNDTRSLVRNVDSRIEPLVAGIRETVESSRAALGQADAMLARLRELAGDDAPLLYEITATLKTLSDAVDSINAVAQYLERHPEALLRGKPGK